MTKYRHFLGTALLALMLSNHALAAVTGASVLPNQSQVLANKSNNLRVNWRISTSSGHNTGAVSATAELIDPSGRVPTPVPVSGPLNASGVGPYSLTESINLSSTDLKRFRDQGIRRILLRRTFAEPPSRVIIGAPPSFTADIVLTIADSRLSAGRDGKTGALNINRLALRFSDGQIIKMISPGNPLTAELTVNYSGSGLLEGRWQISEPGSSAGSHIYRTLSLVRKQLTRNQRVVIKSPELFTHVPGKFRLRFCVTNREFIDRTAAVTDSSCPNNLLTTTIAYQVTSEQRNKVAQIKGLMPATGNIAANTEFSWSPSLGAVLYQLQVFIPPDDSDQDPDFLTGMLVPSSESKVTLSPLVLSKLRPGQRYLWRVTAHNRDGTLLARSEERLFVYHE